MTCGTDLQSLPNGFADFFGGPQKMQAHFRATLLAVARKIEAKLQEGGSHEVEVEYLKRQLAKIQGHLAGNLVTEEAIAEVADELRGYCQYHDFFCLVVPEGKTRPQVWEEIQQKLGDDPVAQTNFFLMVAMTKAGLEMEDALRAASPGNEAEG